MMKSETVRQAVDDGLRPSHEDISARAYELYMERPVHAGTDVEDWLQAERELMGAEFPRHASFTTTRRRATRLAVEHDLASK